MCDELGDVVLSIRSRVIFIERLHHSIRIIVSQEK
jgi:hypothetical protein